MAKLLNDRVAGEARRAADLTQAEIADRLGMPRSFIANVECGERRLDVVEFITLVRQFDADPTLALLQLTRHMLHRGKHPTALIKIQRCEAKGPGQEQAGAIPWSLKPAPLKRPANITLLP